MLLQIGSDGLTANLRRCLDFPFRQRFNSQAGFEWHPKSKVGIKFCYGGRAFLCHGAHSDTRGYTVSIENVLIFSLGVAQVSTDEHSNPADMAET